MNKKEILNLKLEIAMAKAAHMFWGEQLVDGWHTGEMLEYVKEQETQSCYKVRQLKEQLFAVLG